MALVSYTQPAAGQPMQFTMNKNDVLAIPKVMADPFFSSETNWFRVSFVFKHTTSGKRFVPSFRTFTSTKYLRVREGMNGGDGFELKKIIISKSDRTFLVIKTSEIPSVGDYTFSLINAVVGSNFSRTGAFFSGGFPISDEGSSTGSSSYSLFSSDSSKFVVTTDYYNSYFGGNQFKNALFIDKSNSSTEISGFLQDKRIKRIFFKSDLSKAWIVGNFKTKFNNTTLPELPTYNGTTFTSSDCMRLLEVNMSTGSVTHKLDIQNSYDGLGFDVNQTMKDLVVDENTGDVYLLSMDRLAKYNLNSGGIWGKTLTLDSYAYHYDFKLQFTNNHIYLNAARYDSVDYNAYIKINKSNGERDSSLPTPTLEYTSATKVRSVSPDGTKAVYLSISSSNWQIKPTVYVNGTWTEYSSLNIGNDYSRGVIAHDDYFYVLHENSSSEKYVSKLDYSGNLVSSTQLLGHGTHYWYDVLENGHFYINDGKCYTRNVRAEIIKNDLTTGTKESFDFVVPNGNITYNLIFTPNKIIMYHQSTSYICTLKDASYSQPGSGDGCGVAVFNSDGTTVKASWIQDYYEYVLSKPMMSSSIVDKSWFLTNSYLYEISLTTGDVTRVTTLSIEYNTVGGCFVEGNYLFLLPKNQSITVTDSSGSHTKDYMVKINLTNYQVDQSFTIPTVNSWTTGRLRFVDVSDNFIYITSQEQYGSGKQFLRFRKSNFSSEVIEFSTFASYIQQNERIQIHKLDSTRIIAFRTNANANYSGYWSKPYLILNEETLQQSGTQSSYSDNITQAGYDPVAKKLFATINEWDPTNGSMDKLVIYDITSGVRSVYMNLNYNSDNSKYLGYRRSGLIFKDNFVYYPIGKNTNNSYDQWIENRFYSGFIKLNSSGEIV